MGGRGKWSKPTADGFTWYDYHKVYAEDDVHILVQHDHVGGGTSAPMMSQTPNVTYLVLDDNGKPKYVSVYKDRIKQFDADLTKSHQHIKPHIHHCDDNGYRLPSEPLSNMHPSQQEQLIIDKALKVFDDYKKGA